MYSARWQTDADCARRREEAIVLQVRLDSDQSTSHPFLKFLQCPPKGLCFSLCVICSHSSSPRIVEWSIPSLYHFYIVGIVSTLWLNYQNVYYSLIYSATCLFFWFLGCFLNVLSIFFRTVCSCWPCTYYYAFFLYKRRTTQASYFRDAIIYSPVGLFIQCRSR